MLALQGNVRMPPPLPVAVTDRVSPLRLQPNALLAGHVRGFRDECASGEESVPGADAATTGLPKASGVCAAAPTVRAWMRRRRRTASPLLQEERLIRHHRRDRRMGRGALRRSWSLALILGPYPSCVWPTSKSISSSLSDFIQDLRQSHSLPMIQSLGFKNSETRKTQFDWEVTGTYKALAGQQRPTDNKRDNLSLTLLTAAALHRVQSQTQHISVYQLSV